MNAQRTTILCLATASLLLVSGWIVYGAIQESKTKFMTGLPTEDIVKALQPKVIALSDLHPPAPRSSDPVRFGSATSVASVIEFGDFECETCREVQTSIDAVLPKFHGSVRFIWRDLPITDVNPNAFEAAVFARCAGQQGKFWDAHDALLTMPTLGEAAYTSIAQTLGLNLTSLSACRADQVLRANLQNDIDESRADGINTAPLLFIGTTAHQGMISPDDLEKGIKSFIAS